RFSVGQNLYTTSSTGEAESKNWENMIDSFYEEVKDFDKNNIKPFKSNTDYGHFSQLVWATSWRIGCGEAVYKESGLNKYLLVCNYGPGQLSNNVESYGLESFAGGKGAGILAAAWAWTTDMSKLDDHLGDSDKFGGFGREKSDLKGAGKFSISSI
ncbi:CRISP/Allergen/PR-1, partial [Araneus ventricosus]